MSVNCKSGRGHVSIFPKEASSSGQKLSRNNNWTIAGVSYVYGGFTPNVEPCVISFSLLARCFICKWLNFFENMNEGNSVSNSSCSLRHLCHPIQICLDSHICIDFLCNLSKYIPSRSLRSGSERCLVVPSQRDYKLFSKTLFHGGGMIFPFPHRLRIHWYLSNLKTQLF